VYTAAIFNPSDRESVGTREVNVVYATFNCNSVPVVVSLEWEQHVWVIKLVNVETQCFQISPPDI
jgi:hypothetical protein